MLLKYVMYESKHEAENWLCNLSIILESMCGLFSEVHRTNSTVTHAYTHNTSTVV